MHQRQFFEDQQAEAEAGAEMRMCQITAAKQ
jgi:hypothetical protein